MVLVAAHLNFDAPPTPTFEGRTIPKPDAGGLTGGAVAEELGRLSVNEAFGSEPDTEGLKFLFPSRSSSTPAVRSSGVSRCSLRRERDTDPKCEAKGDAKGDVSLCVRLRPSPESVCVANVEGDVVRLRPTAWSRFDGDATYQCDHALGAGVDQERVFMQAVAPICQSVMRGYNGAVIAYGQTGSGKTHTMVGDREGPLQGIAPRTVAFIFEALHQRTSWDVEVSVLEIYNEKARDLLAPGSSVCVVGVHEHSDGQGTSFRCPDAVHRPVQKPEEALDALFDGMQRRETASTDMNHSSSRSHLVFTLTVSQSDPEVGATLRSRLHLVDLAGSERLKRSMASVDKGSALRGRSPNGQRSSQELQKEACEINKSLSQLALVIQRLTAGTASYVPYRDSVLTRLLAESFGGSSKTCLIITCSSAAENREETRCSLEFGKRAKLVRNRAEINLEVSDEISPFVRAFIAKEVKQLRQDRDTLETERDALLAEKASRQPSESGSSAAQLKQLEDDLEEMKKSLADASGVQRLVRESLQADIATMEADNDGLRRLLSKITKEKESLAGKAKKLEVEVASLTQRVDTSSDMQNSALEHSSDWTYGDTGDSKRSSGRGAVATGPSHKFIGDDAAGRTDQNALYQRWKEDVERLQTEHALAVSRLEDDKVVLRQRLQATMCDMLRFSEEKVEVWRKAQEERSSLMAQWQEEVRKLRLERAILVADMEKTKVDLRRRWEEDIAKLREERASTVAGLEHEKSELRERLHDTQEELQDLRKEFATTEAKLQTQQAASTSLRIESDAAHQRFREELARFEEERVACCQSSSEEIIRIERVSTASVVKVEAEKTALQRQLQDATAEATKLAEDRAVLVNQLLTSAAASRECWQADLKDWSDRQQRERTSETSLLGKMLEAMDERRVRATVGLERLDREIETLRACWIDDRDKKRPDNVLTVKNELLRRSLQSAREDTSGIGHLRMLRRETLESSASRATTLPDHESSSEMELSQSSSAEGGFHRCEFEPPLDSDSTDVKFSEPCGPHIARGGKATRNSADSLDFVRGF